MLVGCRRQFISLAAVAPKPPSMAEATAITIFKIVCHAFSFILLIVFCVFVWQALRAPVRGLTLCFSVLCFSIASILHLLSVQKAWCLLALRRECDT